MPPSTPPGKTPRSQSPQPAEGKTAAELFPPDSKGISPYRPDHLINIFIDPKQFFSTKAALGKPLYLVTAGLIAGLSAGISRMDQLLLQTERGGDRNYWQELAPILQAWPHFWARSLTLGAIAGALLWIVGGLWFRLRIRLSGAPDADFKLAQIVYIYSFLVRAIPHLVLVLLWSATYQNYEDAYTHGMALTMLLTSALSFGELFSAYTGVIALFSVERSLARLWFVIIPAIVYALSLAFLLSALKLISA